MVGAYCSPRQNIVFRPARRSRRREAFRVRIGSHGAIPAPRNWQILPVRAERFLWPTKDVGWFPAAAMATSVMVDL